jgi:hypothetical protein
VTAEADLKGKADEFLVIIVMSGVEINRIRQERVEILN